ncbi:LysR family regulator CbbR [Mesobacterium pallidum]|uniref:LysR family regulator CbbR n=1 Tax=Mesobacterium pallidum TaxID=2872037 RepID=UPI001EE2AB83|nr:LysR family transcriptional regulator [Mesobacterium pallidum]
MKWVDQITLRQLRALSEVVRLGTISGAAEALGLTGPAVHNQLKTLEEAVGAPLLEKQGRERNVPTEQGRALLIAGSEMRGALDRAAHQIDALGRGLSGSVVLGVVSTAKYFAPRLVARLHDALPDVEVVLKVGNRQETIQALARHEFDLCIMGRPPREPLVTAQPLGPHPHVLIAAATHPFAEVSPVPRAALLEQTYVMREEGSGTRILAERWLDDLGDGREARRVEMSSNETIKQSVMSGLGVAILSAHTVADELAAGRLVTLDAPGLPVLRHWFLLTPNEARMSPTVRTVRDWLAENTAQLLPTQG